MKKNKITELYKRTQSSLKTITVVGDCILDEFHDGEISRINPEHPSAIYKMKSDRPYKVVPGGAGNTIKQLENFRCNTSLVSIINKYASDVLSKNNVDHVNSHISDDIIVPIKRRYHCGGTLLYRHDIEQKNYGKDSTSDILSNLYIPKSDVVIYSDYNKGIFSHPWFRKDMNDHISIVDPKSDIDKWYGCTIFKPNAKEAFELSGKSFWKDQLIFFSKTLACKGCIITQSGDGVVGCYEDEFFEVRPEKLPKFVENVSGAGDSFISMLALCLAHEFDLQTASEIAFLGGLAYVQRKHNQPNTILDLYDTCVDYDKIIDYPEILQGSKNIIFTNGCFDILHPGHIKTLKYAKSKGDKLVVAVNSDESVKKLKGDQRPINNLESRMRTLASLEFVDYVVAFTEDTPFEIIQKISPTSLVKGGDYKTQKVVGSELVDNVYYADFLDGHSTTNIIEKIKND